MSAPRGSDDDLVMELVERALAQPADARSAFVAGACRGNAALFDEVWRRVDAEQRMDGFLLRPLVAALLPPDNVFEPGDVLIERFRIVRPVAEGGMGIVYEAWDQTLEKRVALKCARVGFRRQLPPEVRNATEITHPNVCRVFEIHTARHDGADVDFVTMEFLEGKTLGERLKDGPVPPAEARLIAAHVVAGLEEAHRRGVVHGDLKANNVILTTVEGGGIRAVITDFGLARGLTGTHSAGPGDVGGTPDYMAPELWRSGTLTVASDIYALGVLLFEIVHGRRPTGGDTSHGPGGWSLAALRHWNRVTARCRAADPAHRYADVSAVRAALFPSRRQAWLTLVMLALVMAALYAGGMIGARGRAAPASVVAVFPFADDDLPAGHEYLSDGLADSLRHTLAQFPRLSVIARSSSERYRGGGAGLADVARQLGGALIVTGRIQVVGDRLRISAELIDAVRGRQRWGGRYEVDSTNLAAVEDEIARRIAEQVGVALTGDGAAAAHGSARSRAYELVLRGQYQRRLYTPDSRMAAIPYFEQALAIDPSFALAHAELATTYRLLAGGGLVKPSEAMQKAEAAARRALAVDPDLAEAHAALADVLKDRWQWESAEAEYLAAIELKPSLVDAHMQYGILLSVTGRYEQALEELRKVRELDPVGLPGAVHAAAVHYNGRRYAEAIGELTRAAIEIDPSAPTPHMWMGMVLAGSGRYDEAIRAYRQAFRLGDRSSATQAFYVYALARSGARDEAGALLDRLLAGGEFVPLTAVAVAYAGLGEPDRTIDLLQQAYDEPDPILQYLKVESHFDSVKERPEYAELARKIGLP